MSFYSEIIALKPGSKEINTLRTLLFKGDVEAARKYVYWCALQGLWADKGIPRGKVLLLFKALLDSDAISVTVQEVTSESIPSENLN